MAWRCSAYTNLELVNNLRQNRLITSPRVYAAMRDTDRALYVSSGLPYEDSPQRIPNTRATISAPHMHAACLEELVSHCHESDSTRVLDVGCGSGYLLGAFMRLTGGRGNVIGIDHIDSLTNLSKSNLAKDREIEEALCTERIKVITGDGRGGYAQEGPYDVIHVGAAAPTVPATLVDQLKCPGKMFVPVGTSTQSILIIEKDFAGNVTMRKGLDVSYVPLTDA